VRDCDHDGIHDNSLGFNYTCTLCMLLIAGIVHAVVSIGEKKKAVNELTVISSRLHILMDIPIKKARESMKGNENHKE